MFDNNPSATGEQEQTKSWRWCMGLGLFDLHDLEQGTSQIVNAATSEYQGIWDFSGFIFVLPLLQLPITIS
jgi:hypothetical protein